MVKKKYLIFQIGTCPQLSHPGVRTHHMHAKFPLWNEGLGHQASCQVQQDSIAVIGAGKYH